jgi:hypothetical protein
MHCTSVCQVPGGHQCQLHASVVEAPTTFHCTDCRCARVVYKPERFGRNRPVHRFRKKPAGLTGFFRFNCTDGLLSEPDRCRLWFGLLPVEPPIRSGLNNYDLETVATAAGPTMRPWLGGENKRAP